MRIVISFMLCLSILAGCNQSEEGKTNTNKSIEKFVIRNPTAEDILAQNPDADIFQWNGIVYRNASNIEWVQTAELAAGRMVGKITKPYKEGVPFEDEMATKLLVGTEIHEPMKKNGAIFIVNFNGKEIRYLGLIEG